MLHLLTFLPAAIISQTLEYFLGPKVLSNFFLNFLHTLRNFVHVCLGASAHKTKKELFSQVKIHCLTKNFKPTFAQKLHTASQQQLLNKKMQATVFYISVLLIYIIDQWRQSTLLTSTTRCPLAMTTASALAAAWI